MPKYEGNEGNNGTSYTAEENTFKCLSKDCSMVTI